MIEPIEPALCPFCEIIAGRAPATLVHTWDDAIAIVPRKPVVQGHMLVIPKVHVADVGHAPDVSAATMRRAAQLAADQWCNVITSRGRPATQSVFHLHLHVVPRAPHDGLSLPWDIGRPRSSTPLQGSGYTPAQLLGGDADADA